MAYVYVAIQTLLVIVFSRLIGSLHVSIWMDPLLNFTVVPNEDMLHGATLETGSS